MPIESSLTAHRESGVCGGLPGWAGGIPPALTVADLLAEGPLSSLQAAFIGSEAARLVDRASREGRPFRIDPHSIAVDAGARVHLVPPPHRPVPRSAWVPPEVRAGGAEGKRSVVWALGRLLTEMLTPRSGASVDPGAENVRLASITRRATAADPRRRQPSLRQLAHELGAFLLDAAPERV